MDRDYALNPAEIGARVRAVRAYANLTRDELAEASGLAPGVIKRMELGIRLGTTAQELHAIVVACGVPDAELFMMGGWTAGQEFANDAREAARILTELDLGAPALRRLLEFLDERMPPREQDGTQRRKASARS
jgi:transcriptional regulator with XRE-family HTH domain